MRLAATILKMKAVLDSYSASVAEQYGLAQVALAEADAKEDKEAAEQLQQNWKKTVEAHRTKARVHFLMALSEVFLQRLMDKYFHALDLSVKVEDGKAFMAFDSESSFDNYLFELMTIPLSASTPSVVNNVSVPPSVTNVSVPPFPPQKPVEILRDNAGQIVGLNPLT